MNPLVKISLNSHFPMTCMSLSDHKIIRKRGEFGRDWKDILSRSIVSAEQLERFFRIDKAGLRKTTAVYPMRINPYYLSLIQKENDPLWKQAVPDVKEIEDDFFSDDPLSEEAQSPVPNLVQRYPDRVLFLVSNRCAMFCRYCMRKRNLRSSGHISADSIIAGLDYIRNRNGVRDVILSGGDPLLLEDDVVEWILAELRSIPHVEVIRIHTRVLCTLPQRITRHLAETIKKFHPVYINTHFNHPAEITDIAASACRLLADAGIPLGCQTVLLKGVNDRPEVLIDLLWKLVKIRIKPYYLHQADLVKGTGHFRTSIPAGLTILKTLQGRLSGFCMPHYMIDLPGGGGKVPLLPGHPDCGHSIINQRGK